MLKTGVHGACASRQLRLGALDVPLAPDLAAAVASQSDAGFSGAEQLLVVRKDGQSVVDHGDHMTVSVNGPVHVFGSDGERLGD